MKALIRRIAQLWLHGTALMLLVGFIQFLAGIPFTAFIWAKPELHPLLAASIILVYFPIAVGWVAWHFVRQKPIHMRLTWFLNRLPGDTPGNRRLWKASDGSTAPLLYLGILALFNAGLGMGLEKLTEVSQSVFERALENPEALPPLTSFVMGFRWWPWIFFSAAIVTGILLLMGRVSSRGVLHAIVWMCAMQVVLGVITFGGYWIPMVSILSRLIG